jgi:hypothetical protein
MPDTSAVLLILAEEGRLPWRLAKILAKHEIRTVKDLARLSRRELMLLHGIGVAGRATIRKLLTEYEYEIGDLAERLSAR